MKCVSLGLALLLWATQASCKEGRDSAEVFHERLVIKPLPDGKVSTHFEFTTFLPNTHPRSPETLQEEDASQHYTIFPLSLAQILRARAITELHLNINAGKWNYNSWGIPDDHGVGTGAELWVWMADGGTSSVNQRWRDLVNGLSGLFCASLGGLDEKRTTSPSRAFHPKGELAPDMPYELMHALLPSESVCTENLTPFLKLLPCKSRSGIATLLNPHRLFDADWHGLGIHVMWRNGGIELKLSFGAVMDPVRQSHPHGQRDWSLSTLFDKTIPNPCPVAKQSIVEVFLPPGEPFQLIPEPSIKPAGSKGVLYNTADIVGGIDVAMRWAPMGAFYRPVTSPTSPVSVSRALTGASQFHGGISYRLINRQTHPQEIAMVDTAPWFVNYFLNTRRVTVEGAPRDDIIRHTSYSPTTAHRPTLLETVLVLPANSTTHLTMSFSKSFIAYTEHPPDAERGWDLPPAVVSFIQPATTGLESETRLYTLNLLINLPTPDFSMPYNVIIMSSTVIALFFGSVFNLLTRKFVWVKMDKPTGKVD